MKKLTLLLSLLFSSVALGNGPTIPAGGIDFLSNSAAQCTAGHTCLWANGNVLKLRLSTGSSKAISDPLATGLLDATGSVDFSAAAAPIAGYIPTATDSGHATWQAPAVGGITQLTSDVTAGPGNGSQSATLSLTGVSAATYGSASASAVIGVDAKGRIGSASSVAIQLASSAAVTGLDSQLSGKQATGSYLTALTGHVVASGPGSSSAVIQAGVVTNAMLSGGIADGKLSSTFVHLGGSVSETVTGEKIFSSVLDADSGISRSTTGTLNVGNASNVTAVQLGGGSSVTTTVIGNNVTLTANTAAMSIDGAVSVTIGATTPTYTLGSTSHAGAINGSVLTIIGATTLNLQTSSGTINATAANAVNLGVGNAIAIDNDQFVTFGGNLAMPGFTTYAQIATPSNPAASHFKFYAKSTGFYYLDSSGTETALTGGGGGGGVTTLAAIGSSPNANAATISGVTLNLQPASASFGGVITTQTQTIGGEKIFNTVIDADAGVSRSTTGMLNVGNANNVTSIQVGGGPSVTTTIFGQAVNITSNVGAITIDGPSVSISPSSTSTGIGNTSHTTTLSASVFTISAVTSTTINGGTATDIKGNSSITIHTDGSGTINVANSGNLLGFFQATAVAQQTAIGASGYASVGGSAVSSGDTFTGGVGSSAYTVGDLVKSMKNLGLIAK